MVAVAQRLNRLPALSPYGLIQESLWPNEWWILLSCMMLNCTSRKQVEQVLPAFIQTWPEPTTFLAAETSEVERLVKPLGFASRRTKNIFRMTSTYVEGKWSHASELPGIGKYGARAWEIFCVGTLGDDDPNDHALTRYWEWARKR